MNFYRITELNKNSYFKVGDVVVYSHYHHCIYKVATPTEPGHAIWMQTTIPAQNVEPLTTKELKALEPHIAKAVRAEFDKSIA